MIILLLLSISLTRSYSYLRGLISNGLHISRHKIGGNFKHGVSPTYSSYSDIQTGVVNLLVDIWNFSSYPNAENSEIDFVLTNYGLDRSGVKGLISHFQSCRDSCAADKVFLMATQNDEGEDVLRLTQVDFTFLTDDEADDNNWGKIV